MECDHDHVRTQKFVEDSLLLLKTFERVVDKMREHQVDEDLIDIVYFAAGDVLEEVCHVEVFQLHPDLENDDDFDAFIGGILARAERRKEDIFINDCIDREKDHFEEPEELVDPEEYQGN